MNEENVSVFLGMDDAAMEIVGSMGPVGTAVKALRAAKNYWLAHKVEKFINKVAQGERDGKIISFQTVEERRENGIRILHAIDKIETEKAIDFLANATISFLEEKISSNQYFRIVKAITNTLYEDLIFLSQHITQEGTLSGRNMAVMELVRSGLMIQAGIDANADIEGQEYAFTTLGRMVDRYAVSYRDEERAEWYKYNDRGEQLLDAPQKIEAISNEELDEIINS